MSPDGGDAGLYGRKSETQRNGNDEKLEVTPPLLSHYHIILSMSLSLLNLRCKPVELVDSKFKAFINKEDRTWKMKTMETKHSPYKRSRAF